MRLTALKWNFGAWQLVGKDDTGVANTHGKASRVAAVCGVLCEQWEMRLAGTCASVPPLSPECTDGRLGLLVEVIAGVDTGE